MLFALLWLTLTACASDASPGAVAPPASTAAAGPVLGTLAFDAFELGFAPATIQVEQPGQYAVTFSNIGHTDHDWVAAGTRLVAKPGETVSGTVVVPAEGLEFVCSLPGHAAAGMRGTITVTGAAHDRSSTES
jgi:nitrite reductase (NO-forming)